MRSIATANRRAIRHNGEGTDYFASMTDLMLGLIFIFIIMLMVLALDMRQSASVPVVETPVNPIAETNLARRDLLRDIAKVLQSQLPVTIDEENGTLQLGGDILFPKGSADVYPEALTKLQLLGKALDQVLPCYAVGAETASAVPCNAHHRGRLDAVYIEGHTDATPIHTARFQNNWDLSAARASATFSHLVESFPGLGTLKNDRAGTLIGVSGYGEYRPVDESGTAAGMQKNRRIELRFIMTTPGGNDADTVAHQIDAEKAK